MDKYYKLTNDFVKEDTVSINKTASQLKTALENLKVDELKKDTVIYETAAGIWDNTKTEITGMLSDPSLQSKRESLNLFSPSYLLFVMILPGFIGRSVPPHLEKTPPATGSVHLSNRKIPMAKRGVPR